MARREQSQREYVTELTTQSTKPRLISGSKAVAGVLMVVAMMADNTATLGKNRDDVQMPTLPEIPFNRDFDAFLHKEKGQVGAEIIERAILVDPYVDDQIVFFAGSETVAPKLRITRPNGTEVSEDDADLRIRQFDRVAAYRMSKPEAGTWRVQLLPLETPEPKPFVLAVTGQGEHNLFIRFRAQQQDAPEGSVRLWAVVGGPHVVKGIRIHGRVVDPKGGETQIVLHDDGRPESGDDHTGDGRYVAILINRNMPGTYRVYLHADGENGMTVVPGDHPDFVGELVESKLVPRFRRYTWTEFTVTE